MISLDNNAAERALRGPVVTRKNADGSRNEDSARLAAVIWTVTATAQMAGLNVLTWLTAYLDACGRTGGKPPTGPALERFLPWTASPDDLHAWATPPRPPADPRPGQSPASATALPLFLWVGSGALRRCGAAPPRSRAPGGVATARALRAPLDLRASAAPRAERAGRPGACPTGVRSAPEPRSDGWPPVTEMVSSPILSSGSLLPTPRA